MEQLHIGKIRLTWLNGGVTHLDGGAMFGVVPKPLWTKKYAVNDKNQIECRTDPILVEVNGKRFLIESGIGNGKLTDKQKRNYGVTEESKIDESLAELGLKRTDIDAVLMTHLHFDHASGLTLPKEDKFVPVFQMRSFIVQKRNGMKCGIRIYAQNQPIGKIIGRELKTKLKPFIMN